MNKRSITQNEKKLILVLDNIRSEHNTGSLFRTADGAGVSKVFLVGTTPKPIDRFGRPVGTIAKTALGAEKTIPYEYYATTEETITVLKKEGVHIYSLEQTASSVSLFDVEPQFPCALIVGNEVDGVSKEFVDASDTVLEIPMNGEKESLNVSVAGGIGLFFLLQKKK
ncbi:MAG: TrmH family RNA methyltransferase [bacterium]